MNKRFGFSLWYFLIGFVVLLLLQDYFSGRHVAVISHSPLNQAVSAGDVKGVTQSLDVDRVRDLFASHRHTRPPVVAAN